MVEAVEIPGLRIERELGRGAWSTVFAAHHGDRACAVKIARSTGSLARWFRREAAALARVTHPGVPMVFDVGEVRGRPYLVMELVEGQTLAERLAEHRMEAREVLELVIELADICVAIHAKGLVHRDIKPRNIVVARGRTRLVDFGLVTHLDPAHATSLAAGTRSYGAPEQFDAPHLVDGRTDLFAIGRVLEECAISAGESARFKTIVDRLIAPDQGDRYPSARVLLEDLENIRAGEAPRTFKKSVVTHSDQLPLVARRAELGELEAVWGDVQRGRGQTVLVEGPAGAGKTRLVEALRRSVRDTASLELWAEGHGQLPLACLRQLFDGFIEGIERAPEPLRTARTAAFREAASGSTRSIVASISPAIARLLEVDHPLRETEQEPFVEAVTDVLVKLVAASGSTLFVVDDFQWVDPVSREVFVRTAASAKRVQLAFVAAARAGARERGPVARLVDTVGPNELRSIPLRPFGEREVTELANAYLGTDKNDPALIARVEALAEGTPLAAVEILHALLDGGALKPHWGTWQFDADMAGSALLPKGATALLARRLLDVPAATRRVLEAAAILGSRFHPTRVASIVGVTAADLEFALAGAARSGLVEPRGADQYRFVHESIRDAVINSLTEREKRELHQRAAETLAAQRNPDRETVLSAANHSAAGTPSRDPKLVFTVAARAAKEAAENLDPETALPLFALAEDAAIRAGIELDDVHFRAVGEAQLRVGALDEGLQSFQRALTLTSGPRRAAILGRIAWVHQTKADGEGAWEHLARAFVELGERLPTEAPLSLLPTVRSSVRASLARRVNAPVQATERLRLETLCDLHYQNARLGVEYEKPARTVASALAVVSLGERLGPSSTLARAYAMYALFMTALGRRTIGQGYLHRGREMAVQQKDITALAQVEQHAFVIVGFAGDFDATLEAAKACIERYGHWIEITEYCLFAFSARAIETLRGRTHQEWEWLELAAHRVQRHGRVPTIYEHVGVPARQATASMRGSPDDQGDVTTATVSPSLRGFHRLLAWGPRATVLAARSAPIEEIEALARAFDAEKINPRTTHPMVLEYYISIAHARAAALRRGDSRDRARDLARLDAALSDLRKAARFPLFKAHLRVLEAERALLTSDRAGAKQAFIEGETLALDQTAPWVLSCAALGLARILLAEGKRDAALEKARIAANLAFENGAMPRFRMICEEFDLSISRTSTAAQTSAASTRVHQLKTMLNVMHSQDREPRLADEAVAVLDELLRVLSADRGLLMFRRGKTRSVIGRTRRGEDFGVGETQVTTLLENVIERGRALTPSSTDAFDDLGPAIKHRWITSPLVLHDVNVGAVYVERAPKDPPFRRNTEDLLGVLGPQVAMTLELARILEEREVLQENLQRAQRMEAVGQLASGIAHDFNNMLTAILASTEHLERANVEADHKVDLQIIREATRRAGDLTEKLLSFARRKLLSVDHLDIGDIANELAPLLKRLLGEHIELFVTREPGCRGVKTDRTSLEQVLINLAVNARDAMPNGGSLTIEVGEVELDEGWVARGASRTGAHVCVTVTDTGTGMTADVQARAFEPFFTTKRPGSGSGLGLASVYGFMKQSEGHVELKSLAGKGTVFTLYFPVAEAVPKLPPVRETHRRQLNGKPATVLIVDDEPLVLQAVQRAMLHEGFEVHVASTGAAAIDLARMIENLDIVITDVLMPSMSGPELARKLRENGCEAPILFVSGHTHGELSERGVLLSGVEFLQKPFTERDLAKRVRGILMPVIEA